MNDLNLNINDLIPQRAPFQLIDEVIHYENQKIQTSMSLGDSHVLVENGRVLEAALAENIAQSAAALSGIEGQINGAQEPKIGVIGSIDRLKIEKELKTPVVLSTFVERNMDFGAFSVISGKVEVEGEVVASCDMKIFIHENA